MREMPIELFKKFKK